MIEIESYTRKWGNSLGIVIPKEIIEKEFWKRHLRDMNLDVDWKILRKELLESFEPQKSMPDLINKLRKGYRVGLLSDQTKEWWPYLNKKYRISGNFDFVIISSLTGFHKPQPEIYKIAIKNVLTKSAPSSAIIRETLLTLL